VLVFWYTGAMLDKKSLSLAGGALWGGGVFLITLAALYTDYATGFVVLLQGLYPGYSVSVMGSVVGFVYGFLDAFVGLYLFASLYNWFAGQRKK